MKLVKAAVSSGLAGVLALALGLAATGVAYAGDAQPKGPPEAACWISSFEGAAFSVCRYTPGQDDIALAWRDRGQPLDSLPGLKSSLGADGSRVAFAMNAGMYDKARSPLGLYVAAGQELRPLNRSAGAGNFFLLPNGVFWVGRDGAPHIDETSAFADRKVHPRWATQSGPLLVRAGALHPSLAPNGTSLAIRNGVGVRGGEALFVISNQPVSFGRFARFLRDGLGCADGLYLDGAISSLWAPGLGRLDRRTGLGTFVVVTSRR